MGGVYNLTQILTTHVQMAKEHVEYSLAICVSNDTKCMIMPYMIM